jgi:hypothetical protein
VTAVPRGKGLVPPAPFRSTARLLACAVLAALCSAPASAQVKPAYLYTLSTVTGPLHYDWVRVQVDAGRDEAYVIFQNVVRVFNPSGMQIFSFGEDLDVGQIADVAVDADGSILVLSYRGASPVVTRCNYRGVPVRTVTVENLPPGVPFRPQHVVYRDGLYYFVSLTEGTLVVTDASGRYRRHADLFAALDPDEKQKSGAEISGFTVDRDGSLYFTVPALFKVFKSSAGGATTFFGTPGSAAGRFGNVAGIAVDSRGNILVADKLKCVVIAFDKAFKFLGEFGYRGARRDNLILPDAVAIDSKDRLYVSQARGRGVSVFALNPS